MPESTPSLAEIYHSYLSAITSRNWLLVSTFAHPTLTHNNTPYTNETYAQMIDSSSAPYKDIKFIPERLVVDDEKGEVACRIRFEWEGEPFWEHVFYQFEEGKIREVWSIVAFPEKERGGK
jgi:predicted ester cyclase